MRRRDFVSGALALPAARLGAVEKLNLAEVERGRVMRAADRYLAEQPVTVTAASSSRSAGGRHDFFSEGDY